jgi:signal transduction histidine kinase
MHRFRAWWGPIFLGWVVLAALVPAPRVAAQDLQQQRVLALYVTSPGAVGAAAFESVYQKTFAAALGNRLDFHSEFIDLARFSEPSYADALAAFLRYKYRRLPPDVILATTEAARQFVERFRDQLFPGIPVVFIERLTTPHPVPGMTGISAPLDLAATVDVALALQPRTARVFVVTGVSEFDRRYERVAREQLRRFAGRVGVTYLSGLTLADLERSVAHLPNDSIIYFLAFTEDGAGARLRSTGGVDRIAPLANAPIYTWHGAGMDHGIVGGRLYTNEIVAEQSAALALRILGGERPESIPVATVDPYLTLLDWRQLRRWGISEADVPKGAIVMFREVTLWGRYKKHVAGGLALMIFQTALIAGLLIQRARGRRMTAEMRENQAMLEASNRQISDLFGRLIAAQENERGRIARDLHDDVSQRVAGLSIMIAGLKSRLVGVAHDPEVTSSLAAMQRNTVGLAEGIRDLSHDLHPSILQHAGLVRALRHTCTQFETLHGTPVTFTADADVGPVDPDTALCLYRIAQEALGNVAKHARATHVEVALTRTPGGLQLTIADDGHGFDLASTRARPGGLGLVSIDERVRLLRGGVSIDTQPRGGTRLRILLPPRE